MKRMPEQGDGIGRNNNVGQYSLSQGQSRGSKTASVNKQGTNIWLNITWDMLLLGPLGAGCIIRQDTFFPRYRFCAAKPDIAPIEATLAAGVRQIAHGHPLAYY